jgi:WD40 repeat protein
VPRDLETIVLKSLAKEPASRYHTAEAIAEDLRRFLADRPILARRSTPSEQFVRWCRRNPAVAALAGGMIGALLLGTGVSTYYALVANHRAREAATALADKDRALVEKDDALRAVHEKELLQRRRFYAAQMNLAQQSLANDEPTRVLDLLEQSRPRRGEPDMRGFEWHYLWSQIHRGLRHSVLWPEGRTHHGLTISPDGKTLAVSGGSGVSPGVIKLMDVDTNEFRRTITIRAWGASVLSFSPDGARLASGSTYVGNVYLWDVATGAEKAGLKSADSGGVRSLGFSPTGKELAVGYANGAVSLCETASLGVLASFEPQEGAVTGMCFSPDGTRLYSAAVSGGGKARTIVRDLTSDSRPVVDRLEDIRVTDVSRDGRLLVGGWQRTVTVWDIAAKRAVWQFAAHAKSINDVRFASDDDLIISAGGEDRMAVVWNIAERRAVMRAPHPAPVTAVAEANDAGGVWASLSDDGMLKTWNLAPPADTDTIRLEHSIEQIVVMPNETTVVLGGRFPAKTWGLETGSPRTLPKCTVFQRTDGGWRRRKSCDRGRPTR